MDKLVSIGNNQFTLTTPNNTKYTFGYAPSNAYLSSITDMDGNTLTINHNPDTTISSIVDNAGRAVTLGYSNGHLSTATDPLGRLWTFNYTGAGDLWYVVDPVIGNTYSYRAFVYDPYGQHDITQTQDHNNNHSYFGYNTADGSNSLAWARDLLGNQTNFVYNANNTVITDPNGHTLTHTYAAGRLASATDSLGKTESYLYDYKNILSSKTDKRGYTSTFSSHFDVGNNNVSTSTDALGKGSSATYDTLNKVTKSVDALGNTTTNAYTGDTHEDLLSTTVSSYPNAPTAFTATSQVGGYTSGLPTTFTDAYQYQSSVAYDPNGWGYVTSAKDANGITTSATYNALGWKLTGTDALSRVTRYTYDNWGRLVVVTAADGTQTGTVYDANGNVLRVADADAYAATPIYAVHCCGNPVGRFGGDAYYSGGSGTPAAPSADLSGVADPAPVALYTTQRGGTFTYTFPSLTPGRLYTLRLHFAESGYTAPGQRQFNVAINGSPALTNFDIFAAAGANNKAVVQEFSIVANGSGQIVVAFTSGAASVPVCSGLEVLPFVHTVANNYDADDRLVSTIAGTGNGNGDIVSYTYDGPTGRGSTDRNGQTQYGLLSSKTDGNGHTTVYTYTARNEPYQTFYADGTGESIGTSPTNGYDADGDVILRVKPDGKGIVYGYDADDRLTGITYPTLHAITFAYDADGRRTQMTDGNGATTWTYGDGLHLTHLNSGRGDVLYDYYLTGPRWHMTAIGVNPSSPTSPYTYTYDPGLRLTGLTNPFGEKTSFLYNPDGTVRVKNMANGAYIAYWYDPTNGQMTDLQFGTPTVGGTYSHHYTYTPAGSLASRSESDGGVNTFVYDGMDQLVSEVRTGGVPFSHGYTYDHNGNRLTQTVNGTLSQQFSYDAHDKLTGGIGESETYDLNGNLQTQTVNGQTTRFSWDDEDRLTGQTFPDAHSDSYGYTGLGMRLTKSDPTGTYSYDADGVSPASDVLSDGHTSFTPGISEYNALGSRFYLGDAQGNSRGLLDANQTNTDGYNWDAFGGLVSRFGTNPTAYAWNGGAGYQSDNDSGLKLLGHRYYDSRTGRFISQDPAGDGDNWYAHADNDPMNGADPSGLKPVPVGDGSEADDGSDDSPYVDPVSGATMTPVPVPITITGPNQYDTGTTSIHGGSATGPAGANDFGVGGWVDSNLTFGLVGASGRDWDSHPTRARWEAAGASAIVVATAVSAARGAAAGLKGLLTDGCFTAGTPVQTDGGTKPIETLRAGDLVATRDLQTGKTEYRKVVRTFVHPAHETVTAQFADAGTVKVVETVTATPEHPFYVAGRGFAALGSLGVGTQVVTRAGPALVLASAVRHSDAAGVLVYNLEVEGDHTYFVGTAGGGVWVHNLCFPAWVTSKGTFLSWAEQYLERPKNPLTAQDADAAVAEARKWGANVSASPNDLAGHPGSPWNIPHIHFIGDNPKFRLHIPVPAGYTIPPP